MSSQTFSSLPFNLSRTVSWIHIGDPHITRMGKPNERDLGKIVDEINTIFAEGGIDFIFLPGDIADDGSEAAYQAVRAHLDRLALPWCAIVGDHDVHGRSFANFQTYVASQLHGEFTVGTYRFLRLNAFSEPRPDSFVLSGEQLDWLEDELQQCTAHKLQVVLLLHCYPSDLKQGHVRLRELLHRYPVLLVDMGHTHYNELSNDGAVLYSATRSTGQIEEGPVGYSVITLDEGVVSWHFVRLGSPALVAITHPADSRLSTSRNRREPVDSKVHVRAKIWSRQRITQARAKVHNLEVDLASSDGMFWKGQIDSSTLEHGMYNLLVTAIDASGLELSSSIDLALGPLPERSYSPIDQENTIGVWRERDILGTQLGPNKNGRKW